MKPMIERDEKGHLTHVRWGDEDECWYDYDADGNIRHKRWGDGTERWYDAAGRMTKWKDRRREAMNTEL